MIKTILRIVTSITIFASFALFPVAVHAVDVVDPSLCSGSTNPDFICKDKLPSSDSTNPIFGPTGILTRVLNILSLVVAVIAAIVIVIAGIRYMVSQGDAGKLNDARNAIIYAIIAIVIASIAQAVVALVLKKV